MSQGKINRREHYLLKDYIALPLINMLNIIPLFFYSSL